MKRVVYVLALLLPAAAVMAGEVTFKAPPAANRTAEGVQITFAVSGPTDVEVAILGSKGSVVRHLAAGVLGGANPPPAPLKPGLTQALVWDGQDDQGQPAGEGPFRVRVRLGLTPRFESFLLYNPHATPPVHSLAVGPKGQVYAFYRDPTANGNQGGVKIKVLDRAGRHLRHLMPYSAALDFDRIKATGAFRDDAGHVVPRVWNWHTLNFYPDPQIARYRSMSSMSLPAVDGKGRVYWLVTGARLAALDADGGVPYETFISDPLTQAWKGAEPVLPSLAVSGDGKWLYLSGLGHSSIRDPDERMRMIYTGFPCVLRVDTATRKAEAFIGRPEEPGKAGGLLIAPRGLAVANGLLYVADPGAGRIAVFKETDGSAVGEVKVESPQTVDVDPKTGAIYACVYTGPQAADLVKFDGYQARAERYRVSLPKTGYSPNPGTHRTIGDFSGDRARLWVPAIPYGRGFRRLGYFEDTGEAFEARDLSGIEGPWGDGARDLYYDRARDELYVKVQGEFWYRLDEATGKVKDTFKPKGIIGVGSAAGTQVGVDSQGNIVTASWGGNRGLMRWDRGGNALPWVGKEANNSAWGGMMTFQLNYLAIHRDELYVIPPAAWRGTQGGRNTSLNVFGLDGEPKRTVIWQCTPGSIPRVDSKGNVYLATMVKPVDRDWPAFFDGKLPPAPDQFRNIGEGAYWYAYMYGSIVKFPPSGGAVWQEPDLPAGVIGQPPKDLLAKPKTKFRYLDAWRPHLTGDLQGAEWTRFGFSPYSQTYSPGTPTCMCEGAGFDVDHYGRLFYPNLPQFRIEVIDTNNNPITTFGRYGNQDDRPETLPMAWPTYVAVSDTHAYVNDTINLRVTRVRLDYAAEAACDVTP